jgi:hypothetical protein
MNTSYVNKDCPPSRIPGKRTNDEYMRESYRPKDLRICTLQEVFKEHIPPERTL